MDYCTVPGLSIAVIKDSEVIYKKAFGVKDSMTAEAVTDETLFEACSLTKPVFAFAVNRLAERGDIDLDKSLYDYHSGSSQVADVITDDRLRLITARHVLADLGIPGRALSIWAR
jgi:CubicO group peptidase (beta-lactamase class C family)